MANVKVSDLAAGTVGSTILGTDIVETQHDPGGGGDASKKSTINQLGLAANTPGCSVSRTSTQSVADNTNTPVQFDVTDTYDTDTMHDPASNNTKITAKTAGIYLFTARVSMAAHVGTAGLLCGLLVNGTTTYDGGIFADNNALGNILQAQAQIKLAVNDYVECTAAQFSGGSVNLTGATLQAIRVGIG